MASSTLNIFTIPHPDTTSFLPTEREVPPDAAAGLGTSGGREKGWMEMLYTTLSSRMGSLTIQKIIKRFPISKKKKILRQYYYLMQVNPRPPDIIRVCAEVEFVPLQVGLELDALSGIPALDGHLVRVLDAEIDVLHCRVPRVLRFVGEELELCWGDAAAAGHRGHER